MPMMSSLPSQKGHGPVADIPKIWVGEFSDTETVVFDTRCQPRYSSSGVVLWGVSSGQFDIRGKEAAKTKLREVRDPVAKTEALGRYATFIQDLLEANHRAWMEALKIEYAGARLSRRSRVVAGVHCYICKEELDGTVRLECVRCGWGLCECGACGCGRGRRGVGYGKFHSLSAYAHDEGYRRWSALPPRSTDVEELCELVGCFPVKVENSFCGGCDSNFTSEWCLGTQRPWYELRHVARSPEDHVLRESELAILVAALERGEVRGSRLKKR
jgi:hypothetical protein